MLVDSVRNWVAAIATISIVLAFFDAILPVNTAGRFSALCGSLILTFVVIYPLADFKTFDIDFLNFNYDGLGEYVEQRVEENGNLEKIIIDNQMTE